MKTHQRKTNQKQKFIFLRENFDGPLVVLVLPKCFDFLVVREHPQEGFDPLERQGVQVKAG